MILIRHNGATVAGAFDTDNYKHNTLAQMALVELEVGDQVSISIVFQVRLDVLVLRYTYFSRVFQCLSEKSYLHFVGIGLD